MSALIRALIVEDEPVAVRRMLMALGALPDVEVVGAARDGAESLVLIRRLKPDVVFLDISLPLISGLEVAARLAGLAAPAVVFVTAYDQFAVRAFDLSAADYLLKPVNFDRVAEAIERVRRTLASLRQGERIRDLERLLQTVRELEATEVGAERAPDDLWVLTRRGMERLALETVERFEAERDYVRVYSKGGEHLIQGPLRELLEKLGPSRFRQVHRSHVVCVSDVVRIERRTVGGSELHLSSGARVPVGRTYASTIRELIEEP